MAIKSFGWKTVATAGTPLQVTATRTPAHTVFIQQVAGNTGVMHIGTSASMDPATGIDMVASLVIPSAAALPSWSAAVSQAANGMDLTELWIDAGVSGDKVLISYVEG